MVVLTYVFIVYRASVYNTIMLKDVLCSFSYNSLWNKANIIKLDNVCQLWFILYYFLYATFNTKCRYELNCRQRSGTYNRSGMQVHGTHRFLIYTLLTNIETRQHTVDLLG